MEEKNSNNDRRCKICHGSMGPLWEVTLKSGEKIILCYSHGKEHYGDFWDSKDVTKVERVK